jgi:hypothetical protein
LRACSCRVLSDLVRREPPSSKLAFVSRFMATNSPVKLFIVKYTLPYAPRPICWSWRYGKLTVLRAPNDKEDEDDGEGGFDEDEEGDAPEDFALEVDPCDDWRLRGVGCWGLEIFVKSRGGMILRAEVGAGEGG